MGYHLSSETPFIPEDPPPQSRTPIIPRNTLYPWRPTHSRCIAPIVQDPPLSHRTLSFFVILLSFCLTIQNPSYRTEPHLSLVTLLIPQNPPHTTGSPSSLETPIPPAESPSSHGTSLISWNGTTPIPWDPNFLWQSLYPMGTHLYLGIPLIWRKTIYSFGSFLFYGSLQSLGTALIPWSPPTPHEPPYRTEPHLSLGPLFLIPRDPLYPTKPLLSFGTVLSPWGPPIPHEPSYRTGSYLPLWSPLPHGTTLILRDISYSTLPYLSSKTPLSH